MQQIKRWTADIQNVTKDFRAEFGQCSVEELNWRPHPKTWSVAQNMDHLITVNSTYFPVVAAIRNGTYRLPLSGRLEGINRFLGNFILKSVSPDQPRKTKTLPLWEPGQSEIAADILQKFGQHQDELIAFFRSSEDLLGRQTVISSPANKYITYTLETAFDIIVAHEKRHFQQARATFAMKQ